jgi:hypothetical protein
MKNSHTFALFSVAALLSVQLLPANVQAHAINTKGTGSNNGKPSCATARKYPNKWPDLMKRCAAASSEAEAAGAPAGKFKWVTRTSFRKCPNGSNAFEADDGGVKCAVELP